MRYRYVIVGAGPVAGARAALAHWRPTRLWDASEVELCTRDTTHATETLRGERPTRKDRRSPSSPGACGAEESLKATVAAHERARASPSSALRCHVRLRLDLRYTTPRLRDSRSFASFAPLAMLELKILPLLVLGLVLEGLAAPPQEPLQLPQEEDTALLASTSPPALSYAGRVQVV